MDKVTAFFKNETGHLIGFFTLLGMALAFVATKEDVNTINSNINMLRMELTIRVNENKLHSLDKIEPKTPELLREIAALEASNQRLESKMEDSVNAMP